MCPLKNTIVLFKIYEVFWIKVPECCYCQQLLQRSKMFKWKARRNEAQHELVLHEEWRAVHPTSQGLEPGEGGVQGYAAQSGRVNTIRRFKCHTLSQHCETVISWDKIWKYEAWVNQSQFTNAYKQLSLEFALFFSAEGTLHRQFKLKQNKYVNIHVKLSWLMNNYTQCTTLHVHWEGLQMYYSQQKCTKMSPCKLIKSDQKRRKNLPIILFWFVFPFFFFTITKK